MSAPKNVTVFKFRILWWSYCIFQTCCYY